MADLQLYRFEPELVSNPEDSESENDEVNDRLEGTFWCSCVFVCSCNCPWVSEGDDTLDTK